MADEVITWWLGGKNNQNGFDPAQPDLGASLDKSIVWIHDILWQPFQEGLVLDSSLSLDEQRHYLEVFDEAFPRGEFFVLDHYMGLPTSQSKVYFPLWLYGEAEEYSSKFTDLQIDFSKKKVAISCCSNFCRPHRLVASCWLANYSHKYSYAYTQSWDHQDHLDRLDEFLQIGNIIDWTHSFGPEVKMLPKSWMGLDTGTKGFIDPRRALDGSEISMCQNFYANVKPIMDQSVFNLVLESSEWGRLNVVTEKYLNCVFSGNIPITFGYGSYDILENMGLDTFKDILDTSGQYEPNLVTRTWKILQDNANQFDHALDLAQDPQIQKRLQRNLDVVKDHHNWLVNATVRCNNSTALDNFVNIQDKVEKQLNWDWLYRIKKTNYKKFMDAIKNV
jgi:hypothetical protein